MYNIILPELPKQEDEWAFATIPSELETLKAAVQAILTTLIPEHASQPLVRSFLWLAEGEEMARRAKAQRVQDKHLAMAEGIAHTEKMMSKARGISALARDSELDRADQKALLVTEMEGHELAKHHLQCQRALGLEEREEKLRLQGEARKAAKMEADRLAARRSHELDAKLQHAGALA